MKKAGAFEVFTKEDAFFVPSSSELPPQKEMY
jgi:hypothetical protein